MNTSSIVMLTAIALFLIAVYGADYSEHYERKYQPRKKRSGRTLKR